MDASRRSPSDRSSSVVGYCTITVDHGISGAKGRNGRPAFDALCRDATKRQFDVVMAWNVDCLGRTERPCGAP